MCPGGELPLREGHATAGSAGIDDVPAAEALRSGRRRSMLADYSSTEAGSQLRMSMRAGCS